MISDKERKKVRQDQVRTIKRLSKHKDIQVSVPAKEALRMVDAGGDSSIWLNSLLNATELTLDKENWWSLVKSWTKWNHGDDL